jgi:hypothetical protein
VDFGDESWVNLFVFFYFLTTMGMKGTFVGATVSWLDLSISRVGFGPSRKNSAFFRAEKILTMTVSWDMSGLSFRAGFGLGRAACAFHRKIIKNSISGRVRAKKIRGLQDLCHVGSKVCGRASGPGQAGLKMPHFHNFTYHMPNLYSLHPIK